jgi:hypothetical protein
MYGGPVAGALLNALSRLFTGYLQWHGFTCGYDDLLLTAGVERRRAAILARAEPVALKASADFVGVQLPEAWVAAPEEHPRQLDRARAQASGCGRMWSVVAKCGRMWSDVGTWPAGYCPGHWSTGIFLRAVADLAFTGVGILSLSPG